MIKRISCHNYRNFDNATANLSSGVNSFVGETGAGKSNILVKLCKFVLLCDEQKKCVQEGKTSCYAEVEFEDGTIIRRTKGKTVNRYDLTYSNGEKLQLNNFGRSIPPQVKEIARLTDVNFLSQFDSHFMLSDTATEKGRKIGEVANSNVIDKATSLNNSDKLMNSKELNKLISEKEELEEKLLLFEDIEEREVKLERLNEINDLIYEHTKEKKEVEDISSKIEELLERISSIEEVLEKYKSYNFICKKVNENIDLHNDCKEIKSQVEKIESLKGRISDLEEVATKYKSSSECINLLERGISLSKEYSSIKEINDTVEEKREYIKILSQKTAKYRNSSEAIVKLNEGIDIIRDLKDIESCHENAENIRRRVSKGNLVIEKLRKEKKESEDNYKNKLKEAGICPLCQKTVT